MNNEAAILKHHMEVHRTLMWKKNECLKHINTSTDAWIVKHFSWLLELIETQLIQQEELLISFCPGEIEMLLP